MSSSSAEQSSSSSCVKSSSSATSCSSEKVESSSSKDPEPVEGALTDTRDGQIYKTVTIGTQKWMAENLNYAYTGVHYSFDDYTSDSASWCYGNDPANCTKYGRLYTWAAAMDSVGTWSTNGKGCGYGKICSPTYPVRGVCPEGWHLPTQTEWDALFTAVGGQSTAGKMLKFTSGWNSSGNGTDAYSFAALPAGFRDRHGSFHYGVTTAFFWRSTEYGTEHERIIFLDYLYDDALLDTFCKCNGYSVRCVENSK